MKSRLVAILLPQPLQEAQAEGSLEFRPVWSTQFQDKQNYIDRTCPKQTNKKQFQSNWDTWSGGVSNSPTFWNKFSISVIFLIAYFYDKTKWKRVYSGSHNSESGSSWGSRSISSWKHSSQGQEAETDECRCQFTLSFIPFIHLETPGHIQARTHPEVCLLGHLSLVKLTMMKNITATVILTCISLTLTCFAF